MGVREEQGCWKTQVMAIFDASTTCAAEGEDEIETRSTGQTYEYYRALPQCSVWIAGLCV